jgi:hypothetical protein
MRARHVSSHQAKRQPPSDHSRSRDFADMTSIRGAPSRAVALPRQNPLSDFSFLINRRAATHYISTARPSSSSCAGVQVTMEINQFLSERDETLNQISATNLTNSQTIKLVWDKK